MMKDIFQNKEVQELLNSTSIKLSEMVDREIIVSINFCADLITLDDIINLIGQKTGVTINDMLQKNKSNIVKVPRQLYMYFARALTKHTLKEIAGKVNKDHTCVLHSRNVVRDMIKTNDPLYMDLFNYLDEELTQLQKTRAAQL